MADEVDPVPIEDRVDGCMRGAASDDQRKVYMWIFSHTERPNRMRPNEFSRQSFARMMLDTYEAAGKQVTQWACFQEVHPLSKSAAEQSPHFHFVAQTDSQCRWREIARMLRERNKVFASASTSSSRASYWGAFAYLYCPSVKKPKEDLDQDYVLSPGHDEPPQRMVQRRQGIRRLQPVEVYDTIVKSELNTCLKVYAFAARQREAGDVSWAQYVLKQPTRKLKETISTAIAMSSATATLRRQGLSHMQLLQEAQSATCSCGGRAIPGWQSILSLNGIDESRYVASLRALFMGGGGKGLNHFYVGDPNTGKTALTRPLLALFGKDAFVKPQVSGRATHIRTSAIRPRP